MKADAAAQDGRRNGLGDQAAVGPRGRVPQAKPRLRWAIIGIMALKPAAIHSRAGNRAGRPSGRLEVQRPHALYFALDLVAADQAADPLGRAGVNQIARGEPPKP